MKRASLLASLLVLVLMFTVAVVQADEPVVIVPYRLASPIVEVSTTDEVLIQAGWGACTRGLAGAFRNAASISLEESFADSTTVLVESPGREYWTEPIPLPVDPDYSDYCVMKTDTSWWTYWNYNMGTLEAGAHAMHFTWTVTHPLPDGGDSDGDGKIDLVSGDTFSFDIYFTINVVDVVD